MDKCCGTCKWFNKLEFANRCLYPIPIWLLELARSGHREMDHHWCQDPDNMYADMGENCMTWEAMEP